MKEIVKFILETKNLSSIDDHIKEGLKITAKTKVNKNNYAQSVDEFCEKYNCKKEGDIFINPSNDVANKLNKFLDNYNDSIKNKVDKYIENNNPLKSSYKIEFYKENRVLERLKIECLGSNGILFDDLLAYISIKYKNHICMNITYDFEDPSFNKETQKEVERFLIQILEYIMN